MLGNPPAINRQRQLLQQQLQSMPQNELPQLPVQVLPKQGLLQQQLQNVQEKNLLDLHEVTLSDILNSPRHNASLLEDCNNHGIDNHLKYIMSDGKQTHMFINKSSKCLYIRRGRLGDRDPTNNGDFQLPAIKEMAKSPSSLLPPPLTAPCLPSLNRRSPDISQHRPTGPTSHIDVSGNYLVTESQEVETKLRRKAKCDVLCQQSSTGGEELHGYLSGRSYHKADPRHPAPPKTQMQEGFPTLKRDMKVLEYARARMKDLIKKYKLHTQKPPAQSSLDNLSKWNVMTGTGSKSEPLPGCAGQPVPSSGPCHSSKLTKCSHPEDCTLPPVHTAEWALNESRELIYSDYSDNGSTDDNHSVSPTRSPSVKSMMLSEVSDYDDLGPARWEDQVRLSTCSGDTYQPVSNHRDRSTRAELADGKRQGPSSRSLGALDKLTCSASQCGGGRPSKHALKRGKPKQCKTMTDRAGRRRRATRGTSGGLSDVTLSAGDTDSSGSMTPAEREEAQVGKHTACGGKHSTSRGKRRHIKPKKHRPSWPSAYDVRRLKVGGFTYTRPTQRVQDLTAEARKDLKKGGKTEEPAAKLPPIIVPSHTNGECPLCELYYSQEADDVDRVQLHSAMSDSEEDVLSFPLDITSLRYTSRKDGSGSNVSDCDSPRSQNSGTHHIALIPDCERVDPLPDPVVGPGRFPATRDDTRIDTRRSRAYDDRKLRTCDERRSRACDDTRRSRGCDDWKTNTVRPPTSNKQYVMLAYTKARCSK